jgi:hypothetical protein
MGSNRIAVGILFCLSLLVLPCSFSFLKLFIIKPISRTRTIILFNHFYDRIQNGKKETSTINPKSLKAFRAPPPLPPSF